MSDFDHHSLITESTPLNTTLETSMPEATTETSMNQPLAGNGSDNLVDQPEAVHGAQAPEAGLLPSETAGSNAEPTSFQASAGSAGEPEYDADDFALELASFDREQAAEKDTAQALSTEETVVTGTVVKITDKNMVVDIGLKSEGLIPLEQVVDHTGAPKFQVGDTIEVVVEREESEGGYLVSYEKALRHKVWDRLEEAANTKTPVTGVVVSRGKGGITVDIGIKAFLPGSQVEIRPVRNLDAYIGKVSKKMSQKYAEKINKINLKYTK